MLCCRCSTSCRTSSSVASTSQSKSTAEAANAPAAGSLSCCKRDGRRGFAEFTGQPCQWSVVYGLQPTVYSLGWSILAALPRRGRGCAIPDVFFGQFERTVSKGSNRVALFDVGAALRSYPAATTSSSVSCGRACLRSVEHGLESWTILVSSQSIRFQTVVHLHNAVTHAGD